MEILWPFHHGELAFRAHPGSDNSGNSFPEDQIKLIGTGPTGLSAEMPLTSVLGEQVPSRQCDQAASPGTEVLIAQNSGAGAAFRGKVVFLFSPHVFIRGQLLPGDWKPAFVQARKPPGQVCC